MGGIPTKVLAGSLSQELSGYHFEDFEGYGLSPRYTTNVSSPLLQREAVSPHGEFKMILANTNEAEVGALSWKSQASVPVDNGPVMLIRLKAPLLTAAVESISFGLTSAQNDTIDNMVTHASIRMVGAGAAGTYLLESDDGTVDNDDQNSLLGIVDDTYRTFRIDASVQTNIRFYYQPTLTSPWYELTVTGTVFTWTNCAANTTVMPYVQVQKASGTTTPSVTVDFIKLFWKRD